MIAEALCHVCGAGSHAMELAFTKFGFRPVCCDGLDCARRINGWRERSGSTRLVVVTPAPEDA